MIGIIINVLMVLLLNKILKLVQDRKTNSEDFLAK